MSRKSILFIGSLKQRKKDGSGGGMFFACRTLSESLKRNGYKIIELNTSYQADSIGDKIPFFRKTSTLVVRNIKFISSIFYYNRVKTIFIFVSAGNSFVEKAPLVLFSKLLRKKVILFPRSGWILRDYNRKFYKNIFAFVIKKSDYIVCQSGFWRQFFIDCNVDQNKLIIVENWYPENLLIKAKTLPQPEEPRVDEPITIVFVGRLEEEKGINDLVCLGLELRKLGIDFLIDIYGEGTYRADLQQKIIFQELGEYIILKGWLKDDSKLDIINKHHIAVFTSRFEGYPNSLLDYIFAKIPIIATEVESIEAIGGNLLNYYNPGNIQEMKNQVLKIQENYSKSVGCTYKLFERKIGKAHIDYATSTILSMVNQDDKK